MYAVITNLERTLRIKVSDWRTDLGHYFLLKANNGLVDGLVASHNDTLCLIDDPEANGGLGRPWTAFETSCANRSQNVCMVYGRRNHGLILSHGATKGMGMHVNDTVRAFTS